jgi:hypothetical protein
MEHPLKPPQSIEEVVVEVFLKILPNFITLKTFTKTSTRRHSPCSVSKLTKSFSTSFEVFMKNMGNLSMEIFGMG